ncbi:MAG: glycosyltransferase [Alphaproteobacteria bacterium]|nr:glycosyltransferase [Alphaproteobacteria bacterium]
MTLRVLTLSTLYPDASRPNFGIFVERQTRELASRAGVDLTVIAPLGIPPWPLSLLARYRALAHLPMVERYHGLTVHRPRFSIIPGSGSRFHPANIIRAILPLARQLHRQNPFDVIDASFFYPDGPAAMAVAAALDIPFSIKARGADIHYWGQKTGAAPKIIAAAKAASGLLAVSAAMREDMIALGMDGGKIRVHYTGVDLDRFIPVPDRTAAKALLGLSGPVVISAGALITRKGQAELIRAIAMLPGVTLLLAGAGPQQRAYQHLADTLGIADRVRFLGSVPHADLPALFGAADVMALPSVSEGLANVWVEALACGTPIVISDAGGAREVVDRAEAGRIVARTPLTIAEAINDLLLNSPAPDAVRQSALRFSWETNGDALLAHLVKIAR